MQLQYNQTNNISGSIKIPDVSKEQYLTDEEELEYEVNAQSAINFYESSHGTRMD